MNNYNTHNIEHQDMYHPKAENESAEALRESEQTLAVTLDSIADGVISTDIDGNIIRMNRVAQQLTGWTSLTAKGLHLSKVFKIAGDENRVKLKKLFESVMSTGTAGSLAPHTELVGRDGKNYLIENSVAPIRDQVSSSPSGIVLVFRDVTEKTKLELEFQQAKKLESIGRLAGGIAHDFNNLLSGILGYSEMLFTELKTNPRLQGYARSVLETSERAAKLTKQLLAFSRKGKMISIPVDLHDLIASAMALLKSATDRRISIVTHFNATTSRVMGDPTLLESALLNLGLNARDATPIGGVISVETNSVHLERDFITSESLSINPGDYIEVTVLDKGAGMTEEVKGHLFEPFFTTKEIGQGTGLGLAAVYGTIKEHQGGIIVKSNVGRGTSFKLYLPICKLSAEELKEEKTHTFTGSGCILLVDDEAIVRETTANMLTAIGYEVLLAENGEKALEIYKSELNRIQLVILDLVMPKLSGPDTFFALKNINKEVKIIFSSGYTFDNGAKELLSNGVFGFIQKPFRRNALYREIQEALPINTTIKQIANR